jgi:lipoprotein
MKNFKLLSLGAVLAVVVTMFSSCLESDDYQQGGAFYFTVVDDYTTASGKSLIQDFTGMKFIPSASSVQALGGLKGIERAALQYTFPKDTEVTENTKEVHVDLVAGWNSFSIQTKDILSIPDAGEKGDTLRNDSVLSYDTMWAYGGYVNTSVTFDAANTGVYMDMIKQKVSADTLYLHLNLNAAQGSVRWSDKYTLRSFRMPPVYSLISDGIKTVSDSIVVAVSVKVKDESLRNNKLQYKYAKYKLK